MDQPTSLYAATKRADELISHAYTHLYALPQTGLRFFTVYGPWGRPDMAYYVFAQAIAAGQPITLYEAGLLKRDFTYIDDIVTGVVGVLDRPPPPGPPRILNIGNNRAEKVSPLVRLLEIGLGRPADHPRRAAPGRRRDRDLGVDRPHRRRSAAMRPRPAWRPGSRDSSTGSRPITGSDSRFACGANQSVVEYHKYVSKVSPMSAAPDGCGRLLLRRGHPLPRQLRGRREPAGAAARSGASFIDRFMARRVLRLRPGLRQRHPGMRAGPPRDRDGGGGRCGRHAGHRPPHCGRAGAGPRVLRRAAPARSPGRSGGGPPMP